MANITSENVRSASYCSGCLSSDRVITPLKENEDIFQIICRNVVFQTQIMLCWECAAMLRGVRRFQRQVANAQRTLHLYDIGNENYPKVPQCLSNLRFNTKTFCVFEANTTEVNECIEVKMEIEESPEDILVKKEIEEYRDVLDSTEDDLDLATKMGDEKEETKLLNCFICHEESGKVKQFTVATYKKCLSTCNLRRAHKLKYKECELGAFSEDMEIGYHSHCYSNYNALKHQHRSLPEDAATAATEQACLPASDKEEEQEKDIDASIAEDTASSGDEQKPCVFCGAIRKKVKGRYCKVTYCKNNNTMKDILAFALEWNDVGTSGRLKTYIHSNEQLPYHVHCKQRYIDFIKTKSKDKSGKWHVTRALYLKAFSVVCKYIQSHVIDEKNACSCKFVRKLFQETLRGYYSENDAAVITDTGRLMKRIKKHFRGAIKFISRKQLWLIVPKTSAVSVNRSWTTFI